MLHWKIDQPVVRTPKQRRPLRDEWGFYDPAQAGLEALIRKVMAEDDDRSGESASGPETHRSTE